MDLSSARQSDDPTRGSTRARQPGKLSPQQAALRRIEAWMRQQQARRRLLGQDGQLDGVVEAGGARSEYGYTSRGDLSSLHEPGGQVVHYVYDNDRRLLAVDDSTGQFLRCTYTPDDRLESLSTPGHVRRFAYDPSGRLVREDQGDHPIGWYRYDSDGRLNEARTARSTTTWDYDAAGHIAAVRQETDGQSLTAQYMYDDQGRLKSLALPGGGSPVCYTWDDLARPLTVGLGDEIIARFTFNDERKETSLELSNGVRVATRANPIDGRLAHLVVHARTACEGEKILLDRRLVYSETGEILSGGEHAYTYDPQGRLAAVTGPDGLHLQYEYDDLDNRVRLETGAGTTICPSNPDGRITGFSDTPGGATRLEYDLAGRVCAKISPRDGWAYGYDGAGHLIEVGRQGVPCLRFTYDYKGRLVRADWAGPAPRSELYLYGPADELLAVADEKGQVLRLYIRTPFGPLAEITGPSGSGPVSFWHSDERGTLRLVTGPGGAVLARFNYEPYGLPCGSGETAGYLPTFNGRIWFAEIGLYIFGARWYDPTLGRFLTPDSYTGAPDDERLLNPFITGGQQVEARAGILGEWLKQPRLRSRYAYCGNDPVGRVDPNGHWAFGGVLLSMLGAIWALPNTLFGLLIEVTCLLGEGVRWLTSLLSDGKITWEAPGFDTAASGNLNAFALVFTGGWLGSLPTLFYGITFGNVFFTYPKWKDTAWYQKMADPVYPPAYHGKVALPRDQVLYEHELRHTHQYGWWGPFFHLGLPLFGYYEWEVICHGHMDAWQKSDAWPELDARLYSEVPDEPPVITAPDKSTITVQVVDEKGGPFQDGIVHLADPEGVSYPIQVDGQGNSLRVGVAPNLYQVEAGETVQVRTGKSIQTKPGEKVQVRAGKSIKMKLGIDRATGNLISQNACLTPLVKSIEWAIPPGVTGVQPVYPETFAQDEEVIGVAVRPGCYLELKLTLTDATPMSEDGTLTLYFRNEASTGARHSMVIIDYVFYDFLQNGTSLTVKVQSEDLGAIIAQLGAQEKQLDAQHPRVSTLHFTCLRAMIPYYFSATGKELLSYNLAYPLVQHALYFVPGVLGSELSVRNNQNEIEECFPEISAAGDIELDLLVCRADGSPYRRVIDSELRILNNVFNYIEIYAVDRRVAEINRMFPLIYLDAAKTRALTHIIYNDIPYDWRLPVECPPRPFPEEVGKKYPFLLEIAQRIQQKQSAYAENVGLYPFLSHQVTLAAHSTGGLILRGLIALDNPLRGKIDQAFFIDVPFLGAPKAEYVFLVGDMDVWVVTNQDSFRLLAPNMFILYMLSASTAYGEATQTEWSPENRKQRLQNAIAAGAYNVEKRQLYDFDPSRQTPDWNQTPLEFNENLSALAEQYQSDCKAGLEKRPRPAMYVFHSTGNDTIYATTLDGTNVKKLTAPFGDGTVPTVSQLGDMRDFGILMRPTPGNPEHVAAPNSPWIWEQVYQALIGQDLSGQIQPWPEKTADLYVTEIETLTRIIKNLKHPPIIQETFTLPKNQVRTYQHDDIHTSVIRLQVISGQVQVNLRYKTWFSFTDYIAAPILVNAGRDIFMGIGRQSERSDQDNQVTIQAISESTCTIDMVSWKR